VLIMMLGAWFALNVPWAQKLFWTHLMELLGGVGHVESYFGPLGDGVSIGERMVHALHHTHLGLEIILDVIDGTPR
jgi:hypothetical protein